MRKRGGIYLILLVCILLIPSFISAEETKDKGLRCLQCGDSCAPYDFVVVASCLQPTKDFKCGVENGECVILDYEEEIFKGFEDENFNKKPGMTPDSAFYFIDKFFDKFGNDLAVREERIAEIKAMVEAGNHEAAKEALMEYSELVEEIKHEVSPGEKDEAVRSAAVIRKTMRALEKEIPNEEKEEFLGVVDEETSIAAAAEIATKINSLCGELSELDPSLFYDSCKVGDEGPKWQKKMYKELTKEQEQEAKQFAKIMGQCFKTSGQDCRCGEIAYESFADTCSMAAPLATACDVNGDEEACEKLDNLNMPDLPPHLQEVMDELEGGMKEKYDIHMPEECQEAGATTPDECGKIMITEHAPEECKEALLAANTKSEREGREICDAIMMKKHAPECVEQGISDPEECKDFMWNIDRRPKECKENRIHDYRDCKEFLDGGGSSVKGPGPSMNFNCKEISDPMERLACYDGATSQVGGYHDVRSDDYEGPCMTDNDWKTKKQECRDLYGQHAGDEPIMGNSGSGYECAIDITCLDFGDEKEGDGEGWEDWGDGEGSYEESECKDGCQDECPGASGTDCVDGGTRCECYYEDDSEQEDTSSEGSGSEDDSADEPQESPPQEEESQEEPAEEEASEESEGSNDLITGNFFLDYWYDLF